MSALKLSLIALIIVLDGADITYPDSICFNGDVEADYDAERDPRTIMGTYTMLDESTINSYSFNASLIDISAPIYQHSYDVSYEIGNSSQYIWKANNIATGVSSGWCLSDSLPTIETGTEVFMSCFEENLLDCKYNRWYWGYGKYQYSIPTVKVLEGQCSTDICIKNLTLQIRENPDTFSRLDGEYYLSNETEEGRSKWINRRDSNLIMYFRINSDYDFSENITTYSYNWVLSEDSADRMACAPGYVDSPLYCTTFVYIEGDSFNSQFLRTKFGLPEIDGGVTGFKMGTCDDTDAPTTEPTATPTIGNGPVTCSYNGLTYDINDTIEVDCEFGYYGAGDIGTCLSDGNINWVQGCFKISVYDDFIEDALNEELWTISQPDTGIPSGVALAVDGSDSLRFIPDTTSYAEVMRSSEKIDYPVRVRATVEKRLDECNLFGIGLGPVWTTRSQYSTRVNWGCLGGSYNKQMNLYNATFRLYDSTCWNTEEAGTMDVSFTVPYESDNKSVVTTSVSNCAPLKLVISDILSQNPWQNAYLWFGTYNDDNDLKSKINDTVIGRFDSVGYTRFFTDFSGQMDVFNEGNVGLLSSGDKLTSNDYYQFSIPFMIKLGIERPSGDGIFAQYLSLGGDGTYVQDITDGVVQIVWDSDSTRRLMYTANGIYYNPGETCSWDTIGSTSDITIIIDSENIQIVSEFCDSVLTASHDLDATQTSLSLGLINDGTTRSGENTEFSYIEVYQYPESYAGNLVDDDELSSVVDLDDLTLSPTKVPSVSPTRAPSRTECASTAECIASLGKNHECETESNGNFCYYSECNFDGECVSGVCNRETNTHDGVLYAYGICEEEAVGNDVDLRKTIFAFFCMVISFIFS